MHILTRRVIRRAIDAGANLSTVEAAADIIALDAAACRTNDAPAGRALPVFDQPVEVGRLKLWTLSIAAVQFINDCRAWFADRPDVRELALVYALAHARSRTLADISTADQAWRAIRIWALLQWRVPVDAVRDAVAKLIPADPDAETDRLLAVLAQSAVNPRNAGENDSAYLARLLAGIERPADEATDYGVIITRLMRELGGTVDDWIFAPLDRVSAVMEALNRIDGGKTTRGAAAMKAWAIANAAFLNKYAPDVLKAA